MNNISESIRRIIDFDWVNSTENEIEEILPTFGMNDEYPEEIPSMFKDYMGWGVRLWQYPNQLSKLITFLKGKKINSYLEIGVRYGGTFIIINEVLKRYNDYVESHCLDIIPPSEILDTYQHTFVRERFYYHQMYSQNTFFFNNIAGKEDIKLNKKIDLVFIDGCHGYTCVKQDYFSALMLGAKYIIFHDIVNHSTQGNQIVWRELKKIHTKTYEFVDQYEGMGQKYMGIGVIEVSPDDKIFPLFSPHY
jgi:cephalosporin hydroxylase